MTVLSKMSVRERMLLYITIAISVAVIVYFMGVSPAIARNKQLRSQIATKESQLEVFVELVNNGKITDEEYNSISGMLSEEITEEEVRANLQRELNRIENIAKVLVTEIGQGKTVAGEFYDVYEVTAKVKGRIDGIARFLAELKKSPKLIRVNKLDLRRVKSESEMVEASIDVRRVLVAAGKRQAELAAATSARKSSATPATPAQTATSAKPMPVSATPTAPQPTAKQPVPPPVQPSPAVAVGSSAQSLVVNGSFEQWDGNADEGTLLPRGWKMPQKMKISQDFTYTTDNGFCLKAKADQYDAMLYQEVTLSRGVEYTLSFKGAAEGTGATVFVEDYGVNSYPVQITSPRMTAYSRKIVVESPLDIPRRCRMAINVPLTAGSVYVDELVLSK